MNIDIIENILNSCIVDIPVQTLIRYAKINSKWRKIIMSNINISQAIQLFNLIEQDFYYNTELYDENTYKRDNIRNGMFDKNLYFNYYSSITQVYVEDDIDIGVQYIVEYKPLPLLWNYILYLSYKYVNLYIKLLCPHKTKLLIRKYRKLTQQYISENNYELDLIQIIPMVHVDEKYLCCIVSPTNADLYDKDFIIIDSVNIYEDVYKKSCDVDLNGANSMMCCYNIFKNYIESKNNL